MAESSTSAKATDKEQGAILNSPMVGAIRQTKEKDPPRYGAQYRQGALWKGGNGALPPQWFQSKTSDDEIQYQDNSLVMVSWNRPLPGVRLDNAGQLVPGCEWHISPLGRSYFVDHNTRTTSWKKSAPERPPASLTPECVIVGHSKFIWNIVCFGTGCNILSASRYDSIRQWTRDGEPVGKPWVSDGGAVCSIAMSPDESMVVSGSSDSKLRLWNMKMGSMVGDPWEGHDSAALSLNWSPNAQEIASGSEDGTIRRWNPGTGRQIAPPIETGHGVVHAVRYSAQGDKSISSGADKVIRVWSNGGELLMKIEGHDARVVSLCWSKDGAHIFSASFDNTIRKWRLIDGKELVVFRGHTSAVVSLCLSPDEGHLVSTSLDCSVRIWDLRTNHSVGDPLLHDDEVWVVDISPDGKYIVSGALDAKIYVWSMEAALNNAANDHCADESNAKLGAKLRGPLVRPRDTILRASQVFKQQPSNRGLTKYGKDFWDGDTNTSCHPTAPHPQRWNFNLFPGGSSIPTVEVAAGRKKNRIYVSPPSAAEVARAEAAAAAQHANGNQVSSSTQVGQPQASPGTQVSQGPTETQGAGGGTGDVSYEGVNCCGFFFGRRRPTSHQS